MTDSQLNQIKADLAAYQEAIAAADTGPWTVSGRTLRNARAFDIAIFGDSDPRKVDAASAAFCALAREGSLLRHYQALLDEVARSQDGRRAASASGSGKVAQK